jgi:hypothetical protein
MFFFLLSGSKSTFFSVLQLFFLFVLYNHDKCINCLKIYKGKIKKFLVLALAAAMVVIFIQQGGNFLDTVTYFLVRLVAFGDVYIYAYPNNVIEILPQVNGFAFFFSDLFRTIRIIPETRINKEMGLQLARIILRNKNVTGGPNPRMNIVGYVNFGLYGNFLFCFFCGILLAICRNQFLKNEKISPFLEIFAIVIYTNVAIIETDPSSVISGTTNIILVGFIYLIAIFITKYLLKKGKNGLCVS